MKALTMLVLLLAAACSAHRTRLHCDGRLQPINAPVAVVHPERSPTAPKSHEVLP